MKRFFNFLLFVSLLAIAVGSLQTWKDRRYGRNSGWANPFLKLIGSAGGQRQPEKYTLATGPSIDLKDVNVLAAMSRERVTLARAVVPSVVSIVTSRTVEQPDYQREPFYQFFHGKQMQGHTRTATQLGSGAIVSKEGHIVTNNHVIEGMDEIAVKLSDGRERTARLIGTDTDTDVAVLKIDADHLVPLPFGDSDQVEVGETVMAVGNPYGWEESVTQGIISAKGRRGSENVSDLFQIDAAINPGNSGGPLVNVRGELIGLNEAIFSRSGGWQGVGFAIPSGAVRRVVDGILKTGRVIHSYLGVRGAMLEGPVLVDSVEHGSPADRASIQPGDVIQKFNGTSRSTTSRISAAAWPRSTWTARCPSSCSAMARCFPSTRKSSRSRLRPNSRMRRTFPPVCRRVTRPPTRRKMIRCSPRATLPSVGRITAWCSPRATLLSARRVAARA